MTEQEEWAVRFYDGEILHYDDEQDAREHAQRYGGEVVRRMLIYSDWEKR